MDEHDRGNLSATTGKKDKYWMAELSCATLRIKLNVVRLNQINQIKSNQWKTTFGGRQPSVEDDLWWKTTFGERPPSGKDNLRWKATFGGRNLNCYQLSQPEIENASVEKFMRHCACTHIYEAIS